ncbi:MAG TPA: hypothetical protein VLG37_05030 [Candidatus Saccharimonadales bacterium]|nr:hypothetical protein [Candidatus Saccharimonadales bacterium]
MGYSLVGLTGDDILAGMLAKVQNAVSEVSMESLSKTGSVSPTQAEILFDADDASLENDFDTVLYINPTALEHVKKTIPELKVIRVEDNPPTQQGILISVPIYR